MRILASDPSFQTIDEDNILELLLQYTKINPNVTDSRGETSLLKAVVMGNLRVVEILRQHPGIGLDQERVDDG